jgi:hypothetical protein
LQGVAIKFVYGFGRVEIAESHSRDKTIVGGKGANLAEMAKPI